MHKFGRIGWSLICKHRWGAPAAAVLILAFTGQSATAQEPEFCDTVLSTSTGAYAAGVPSGCIPMSKPLFECSLLDDLWSDSALLNSNGSAWIEHIAGGGPGWEPYTGVGVSAPFQTGSGVVLFGARGLFTNNGNGSGSLGVHHRFYLGHMLFGAGFWYDATQSQNEKIYQQTSVSLEWFPMSHWTFRANGYMPVGTKSESIEFVPSNAAPEILFQGNNLLSSTFLGTQIDEVAMRGFDVEVARNILTWSGEVFLGYYNYRGDIGGGTDGIKAGVRGYLTERLAGSVTYADDPTFGRNVFGGLTWYFGGSGARAPRSLCDKLTIPVERNPQIVIDQPHTRVVDNEVLTFGGQPITVTHVTSQPGGTNMGTYENPFVGLPDTQNTSFVYVHGNSTFSGQTYALNTNQNLLGEGNGVTFDIETDDGFVMLPEGNGGLNQPVIQNTPVAIEVTDGSSVSNFRISDATVGVQGMGVSGDVELELLTIEDGGIGVNVQDSSGQFELTDVSISDSTVAGLWVQGGTADVTFGTGSSIQQSTTGAAVLAGNGHNTGTVEFTADSTITATNGAGLGFVDADGTYNFDGPVTLNGGNARISIINESNGTFQFGAETSITSNDDTTASFIVNELDAMGEVNFAGSITGNSGGGDLVSINGTAMESTITFSNSGTNSLSGDGAGGISIIDADGDVTFDAPIDIQNPTNAAQSAGIAILSGSGDISFSDTSVILPIAGLEAGVGVNGHSGSVAFNNLQIETNGDGTTGLFAGNVGELAITGTSSITTTGGPAIHISGADDINMTFADITVTNSETVAGMGLGNGIFLNGIDGGTFNVTGITTIDGANGTTMPVAPFVDGTGIYINDSSATFTFAEVDISNTVNDGITIGINGGNPGTVNVNGGSIINTGGDGVRVHGAGGFNLNDTMFGTNTGDTIELMNSTVSGSGNTAVPFNPNDGGGNMGTIFFNGGADQIP